jgi:hypothetical protein
MRISRIGRGDERNRDVTADLAQSRRPLSGEHAVPVWVSASSPTQHGWHSNDQCRHDLGSGIISSRRQS